MTFSVTPEPAPDWLQRNLFWVARTSVFSYAVVALSLIATVATFLIVTGSTPIEQDDPSVNMYLLVVDGSLLALLAALVIGRLVQIWMARRSGSAGARLHGRLVTIFSLIAVVPVVLTAFAAGITINLAIETWFNQDVRKAVDNSLAVAQSYLEEHKNVIRADTLAMAQDFRISFGQLVPETDPQRFSDFLKRQAGQRGLPGAGIYDASGQPIVEVQFLVLSVDAPTREEREQAQLGPVLKTDSDAGLIRAIVKLDTLIDLYLVTVRVVNEKVLAYQQDTQQVVSRYNQLERDRNGVLWTFTLMYGLIAFVILFAAIWIGLGTANRIVTPIGRLIGAAERISEGDLAARVMLASDDDELATLGKAFNRMTGQLQSQRNELIESHRQTEQRRRFTEAVLSGVSAGVVGLDGQGRADVANRSALNLLSVGRDDLLGQEIGTVIPEIADLVQQAMASTDGRVQSHIDITRGGKTRNLNVTVTRERAAEDESGYVVTFDDITDLISAQRTSAWADVARRIAHEIKNPLTPIQLSAERLRRKYKKEIASDPEVFEQCTQTIIRQVGDIGRMVDEFSSFARMPQPVMRDEDICELIKHSVFLQRVAQPQITFALLTPDIPTMVECDGRLVSQALTNVLKNATEAVRARFGTEGEEGQLREGGRIEIRLVENGQRVSIEIIDNGIGLPSEDRNRLTEPYVTKRAKGTGLGLAIVKKIMEDHKGVLSLEDAPKADETGATRESGALVRLTFLRRLGAVKLAGE